LAIRAALGVSPRGLVARVLRSDVATIGVGTALGLFVARAVASAIAAGLLFGVKPDDFGVHAIVVVLTVVCGTAFVVPALRVAKTDPLRVLRGD
jgi:putative ABC transport system permease protein